MFARLSLEALEERSLPATHLNAFARFSSGDYGDATAIPIQVRGDDFKMPAGVVTLGFAIHSGGGDSGPIRVRRDGLSSPTIVARRSGFQRPLVPPVRNLGTRTAPDGDHSLTLVTVTDGRFRVTLPARAGSGDWSLDVFLVGDVNRDCRVNAVDLALIRALSGQQFGQAGYVREADANCDGAISPADWKLARRNLGAATSVRSLHVVAGLSPASDPDGNGVVLQTGNVFLGQARAGQLVRLDLGADGTFDQRVTAGAGGRFGFNAALPMGTTGYRVVASDGFGQRKAVQGEATRGDVVLDWNEVHLTAIRDYTTLSQVPYSNRIVFTPPPLAARNLAMAHVAVFDAVNSVEGGYRPYAVDLTAAPGTSAAAAAAAAAHRVLSALYPKSEQLSLFDAALAESLAAVPDGPGEAAGVALGQQVADAILALRANDGSKALVPYLPGAAPGDWVLTEPDFLPPVLPQWPGVTPFAIPSGDAFRPAAPPALDSAEYVAAYDEVRKLGRYDSTARTAEQTEIALFWADGGGTFTPPGHWNRIAATVAAAQGNTLLENARLFALVNVAMADAGISCWDAKYHYDLWRPITAIARAADDGNVATEAEAGWIPLLKTPAFPTYTSGHSSFSGAAAAVLAGLYGDAIPFTSRSDALQGFTQRPAGVCFAREFTSFTHAAEEASRSRVYGGIHFTFDCHEGLVSGQAIGAYVLGNVLGQE